MNDQPKPYTLTSEDKATTIILYTPGKFLRGEVVTRQILRVSTWLRTQAAPEYLQLYNAQMLLVGGPNNVQTVSLREMYVHIGQVMAYHIAPPGSEPPDYDASEPNRKMAPVSVLVGSFRFNACMRMSTSVDLHKYLDTSREKFTSLYDVEVTNPWIPSMMMKIPMAMVRSTEVIFSPR